MMEPLMAKLPGMLLDTRSKKRQHKQRKPSVEIPDGRPITHRSKQLPLRCDTNQEELPTPVEPKHNNSTSFRRKQKGKKKSQRQQPVVSNIMEEVAKRKQMFAQQSVRPTETTSFPSLSSSSSPSPSTTTTSTRASSSVAVATIDENGRAEDHKHVQKQEAVHLPTIAIRTTIESEQHKCRSVACDDGNDDADDSVDEDELKSFLSWTDHFASPDAEFDHEVL
jgi:hypothetical protein